MEEARKILICGLGAIGSSLGANLANDLRGKARLTLLDFDAVEKRNLVAGQFYLPEQEGMPKPEALQLNLYRFFGVEADIINQKLEVGSNVYYSDYDLIIDCFDNYEARKILQTQYEIQKLNILHSGFSPKITFSILWAEGYEVPDDILSDFDLCDQPDARSFVQIVAGLTGITAIRFLETGEKKNFVGNRFAIREI